jgi:hypothetical protein
MSQYLMKWKSINTHSTSYSENQKKLTRCTDHSKNVCGVTWNIHECDSVFVGCILAFFREMQIHCMFSIDKL